MKLLTVTIPCYNSQEYMEKCIKSLLPGGSRVQIVIIDDGSKDATGEIADRYAAQYPDIVTVVHQPNGGHGEGINQGLKHAQGKYFKVVDSDDWVDEEALHKILMLMRHLEEDNEQIDMLISNYVYEKVGVTHKKCIHYRNVLPQDEVFRWMISDISV